MLVSLTIRNFVLIEDAVLDFSPGLTALTGETGAGKTLLTQALELLMGERAAEGLVGPRGDEALVQAVFEVGEEELARLPGEAVELAGLQAGMEVIVSRRLLRGGRNRAFLNGVSVGLQMLGEAVGPLLAFSGQHEHRRLLQPAYQREVLDAFAGDEQLQVLAAYRAAYEDHREMRRRLEAARESAGRRDEERRLLGYQVAELEQAALSVEEEAELVREQRRLSRAAELAAAAGAAATLLSSDEDAPDAASALALARQRLAGVAGVDDELDEADAQLAEAAALLGDAARQLSGYASRMELDPERLAAVDQRLRTYTDLTRKYSRNTAELVIFFEQAAERLARLESLEDDLAGLEQSAERTAERVAELARELSARRQEAAPRLAAAIERELADLDMSGTEVIVAVTRRQEPGSLGVAGADDVQVLVAPNAGLAPRSLQRTASGGELSRTLLAVKAALSGLEGAETLVFDEVDAGIGGRTATAVGRKLWQLSRDNQLLVVTHLPQVAAFAQHHFLVEKVSSEGAAATRLVPLGEDDSLQELCRMMGGEPGDPGALAHARSLKDRAAAGLVD